MAIGSFRHGLAGVVPGAALVVLALMAWPRPVPAQEATVIQLPAPRLDGGASIERVLAERRSVRAHARRPVPLEDVAQLLWAAQGVTEPGRGLRTAPSAGATYPLETYLVAASVAGLEPGLYRYDPASHGLVPLRSGDLREALADASLRQASVATAPLSIVLAAVHARTEARYGGRAGRYVAMEVGTAAQNVALQAVSLGLGMVFVGAFRDDEVRRLLGLSADQDPLAILPVGEPAP